ncbi:type IV pilin protein [Desulfurobacterium sp.]
MCNGRGGFSLIELLIVIVILSVLTIIAVPSYMKFRNKSVVAKVQQNLLNCIQSLCAEYADNGTASKECAVPGSEDRCLIVLDTNGKVYIATRVCQFYVDQVNVKCEIIHSRGDLIGKVKCYISE